MANTKRKPKQKYPRLHGLLDELIEKMIESNGSVGSLQFEIPGAECCIIVSLDSNATNLFMAAQQYADEQASQPELVDN